MGYNYKVVYVLGKQLILADCLSRKPSEDVNSSEKEFAEEIDYYICFITDNLPATRNLLQRIKDEQKRDHICGKLKEFCLNKWPTKDKLLDGLLAYHQLKNNILFSNGFLMLDTRLIIPPPLQRELLSKIHEGHLGINKCRERAKQSGGSV